jgi:4-hydroxy-tetrahydrodipicolinate synthase
MTMTWPHGLLTALVTPLADDKVNAGVVAELIDHQIDSGIVGFVVGGGTGEFGALSMEERKQLAVAAIDAAQGRVPVVIQTGTLNTRDAVELSIHAEASGADAIMVASPFGESINWRERFHFYEMLTAAVHVPVMIYNTPPSGLLTFEQITELATLPNVRAVKDSSGSPELMGDLVDWADDTEFGVYVGLDSLLYDAVRTGARGAVFGAANLIPGPLSAVAASLNTDGPTPDNAALWRHIRPFLRFVEVSPNYVALCKAGLAVQGFDVGPAREPYLMPEEAEIKELTDRLQVLERAFADSPLSA